MTEKETNKRKIAGYGLEVTHHYFLDQPQPASQIVTLYDTRADAEADKEFEDNYKYVLRRGEHSRPSFRVVPLTEAQCRAAVMRGASIDAMDRDPNYISG